MGKIIVNNGDSINFQVILDGIEWNGDSNPNFAIDTFVSILQGDEVIAKLGTSRGFTLIRRSDSNAVFLDVAISDSSFMNPGLYKWKIIINDNNGNEIKSFEDEIEILNNDKSEEKKEVRPWDLFSDQSPKVDKAIKEERMSICKQCDRYILGICKECGCVMNLKTLLVQAYCPLHKWQ